MKIAAVFGNVGSDSPRTYVERMCKAQLACDWHTHSVFEVPGGAIGIVRTSEKFGKIPMFLQSAKGNILAISGVPIKGGKLTPFLHRVVEMSIKDASAALTEIDGAYAALFWNAEEQKAILVTDFMGFQPVYFHRAHGGVALASEIKAFSVGDIVPVRPDPAGWGAFVAFGHAVGEQTQLVGVSKLRGERLCFDPERNNLTKESHWVWPERSPQMRFEEISTEFILDCFRSEIDAYREYDVKNNTLLMSSGFDSRFILCLLKEKEIPVNTLSVVHKKHFGGAEGKLGYRVAKHLGVEQARLVQELSGLQGELAKDHYLMMNDVSTPGRGLFISNVSGHVENLSGAVWEGFSPGYTLTQVTDRDMDAFLAKKKIASDSDIWRQAAAVFSQDFVCAMQEALLENINRERELYGDDDYGVMRFNFKNRALNRTVTNPLKVYANYVIPFTPGMSQKFWNYISTIPPLTIKDPERKLFRKIYSKHYKKACDIPFCSESGLFAGDKRLNTEILWKNFIYSLNYYYERRMKIPFIGSFLNNSTVSTGSYIDDFFNKYVKNNKETTNFVADCVKSGLLNQAKNLSNELFYSKRQKAFLYYFLYWADVMEGR